MSALPDRPSGPRAIAEELAGKIVELQAKSLPSIAWKKRRNFDSELPSVATHWRGARRALGTKRINANYRE